MKTLLLLSLFSLSLSSTPFPDDCRVRLRYLNFNEMSEKEQLQWLNCAFDALKGGEDKHLKIYEKWLGKTPDYVAFQKEWTATFNDQPEKN